MKLSLSLLVAALLLVLPASALAKGNGPVYVPPNQSAASQYTEAVPTAGGDAATSHVHHTAIGGSSATGSGGGSSGVSGTGSGSANSAGSRATSAGGSVGSTSISRSTLSAMSKSGSAGKAAASVARALAPAEKARTSLPPNASSGSATGQVVKTLTGSDAGGGVGVLLPIILIGSLLAATGLGLFRSRLGATF